MVRINKIIDINSFQITGQFNDGQIKRLDVCPLIKNHLYLNGVSSIFDETIFKNATLPKRPGSQLVTHSSVKYICAGSIPAWDTNVPVAQRKEQSKDT